MKQFLYRQHALSVNQPMDIHRNILKMNTNLLNSECSNSYSCYVFAETQLLLVILHL